MGLRHSTPILSLLSFGTGAADAFALTALGGTFTANMTGNAILAVTYDRAHYGAVAAGALVAIGTFGLGLYIGFRLTRSLVHRENAATLATLAMSAACLMVVALLWWLAPHNFWIQLCAVAASATAMALQTVAAKRDGVPHGAMTTFATGTFTDLIGDIASGDASFLTSRWLPIGSLPLGAAGAVAMGQIWPALMPLVPLGTTSLCIGLLAHQTHRQAAAAMPLPSSQLAITSSMISRKNRTLADGR